MLSDFFKNKKIFITGHKGFKGAWLCSLLQLAGAEICGYSLDFPKNPSLFDILKLEGKFISEEGDICDREKLHRVIGEFKPEIVIHMAAQPIVRVSYEKPYETFQTNVMGTVSVLEAARLCDCVRSFVNVTTDKVYENKEWCYSYRENDVLNGYDPYSNSKSCSELVTSCYFNSFFQERGIAVSTARAGNVIGGGDFAADRIIPDCIRAVEKQEPILIKNPNATRPYQHVLDVLYAYLLIAAKQYDDPRYSDSYNVGPNNEDCVSNGYLVDLFCKSYKENASWRSAPSSGPHEANRLQLDSSKIRNILGWKPVWNIEKAIYKSVEWAKCYLKKEEMVAVTQMQIKDFLSQ